MKGIFAFDIDGTLTSRRDGIEPEVVARLRQLAADGWIVALLTGRVYSFAFRVVKHLDFPFLLGVHNGADIFWMPDGKELKKSFLKGDILPVVEKAHHGIAEDFIIYSGKEKGDFCYYRPERFSEKTKKYLQILEELGGASWEASDFSFKFGETFPLIKCFGTPEEMTLLNRKLMKIPQMEVSMIRDPIDTSLYLNLITHPEANKGSAAIFLKDHFKVDLLVAAGDDQNDLKMLEAADVCIAIENAPKELLEIAHIIAKPPEKLGILGAIEEALLYAGR